MDLMDKELTADIMKTLFDVDIETVKGFADAPDKLFNYRWDLELAFAEIGKNIKEELYIMKLNLPMGRMVATTEDWEALRLRLATTVEKKEGLAEGSVRPATFDELCDFYNTQFQRQIGEAMAKRLAEVPAERMYQA